MATIFVWNPATGEQTKAISTGSRRVYWAKSVAESDSIFVKLSAENSLRLLDTKTGEFVEHKQLSLDGITSVAFNKSTSVLAMGSKKGTLSLLNWPDAKQLAKVDTRQGAINDIAFSADGTRIATAGDDTTVLIWESAAIQNKP